MEYRYIDEEKRYFYNEYNITQKLRNEMRKNTVVRADGTGKRNGQGRNWGK